MRKLYVITLSTLVCAAGFALDNNGDAYTVPPKVYVGDRASLILPLPGYAAKPDAGTASANSETSLGVTTASGIDIHRALIERRPSGGRLTVEFTAYAPGVLELPPVTVAGEVFSGLKIEISSVLEDDAYGMVLSGPAPPLAIPGTSLLVYGGIISVICSLSAAFWILIWGRKRIRDSLALWEKKRLLAGMRGTERRLRKTLARDGGACRNVLDALSGEFRRFLSGFTGERCTAMTAVEFANIDAPVDGEFLKNFFKRCDGTRFGGGTISKTDAFSILDDLKRFLTALSAMPGIKGGDR